MTLSDPKDIANAFNDYFVNICKPDVNSLQTLAQNNKNDTEISFTFDVMSDDFLRSEIRKLSPSKVIGIDNINANLLKFAGDAIIPPLLHIFNLSLSTGTFPEAWKTAKVTPIYKSGDRELLTNYRPISLLPLLSKISNALYPIDYIFIFRNIIYCSNMSLDLGLNILVKQLFYTWLIFGSALWMKGNMLELFLSISPNVQ